MTRLIYLDNNATTRIDEDVLSHVLFCLQELYGNASSTCFFGTRVRERLGQAREEVASLLGAHADEIVFTSGGTESDNAAINSALLALPARRHIVTSRVEHLAVLESLHYLRSAGYRVSEVGVGRDGSLAMEEYAHVLDDDTALVSLMWANNETGVIFPVETAAAMAKERGALFHTDAVQAVGKMAINLAPSSIDMLSLSGHKLHAPKGIGALYVRRGTPFHPLLRGGHQEGGRRAGTENTAAIAGLGRACTLAAQRMHEDITCVGALRNRLEQELTSAIPRARVNGAGVERLSNTLSLGIPWVDEDAILDTLSQIGVCASSGSACNSRSLEPSHVLSAMSVPATYINGTLRFSLSRYSTNEDIEVVIQELPAIVERLQAQSLLRDEFEDE